MSLACANLFPRNISREYLDPDCKPAREAQVAKLDLAGGQGGGTVLSSSSCTTSYAIQLQLLGGIIIIQTLPAVIFGLYTNKLNPWALLIGWGAGIGSGTWMAYAGAFKVSIYPLQMFGYTIPCYAAVSSLILNIIVSFALSWLFNAVLRTPPNDETVDADYA